MKTFLTQWETEEENQKTSGNMPLIDRERNSDILLLNGKYSGDVLFTNRALNDNMLLIIESIRSLEDDAECASFPKLTELVKLLKLTKLVKKPSNLIRTGKKKPHCPISYSLARFVEPVGWPYFCFVENLTGGLTNSLAMGGMESSGEKVAVGFSG